MQYYIKEDERDKIVSKVYDYLVDRTERTRFEDMAFSIVKNFIHNGFENLSEKQENIVGCIYFRQIYNPIKVSFKNKEK